MSIGLSHVPVRLAQFCVPLSAASGLSYPCGTVTGGASCVVSERADPVVKYDKGRLKEGANINKSLVTLGYVIQALGTLNFYYNFLREMASIYNMEVGGREFDPRPGHYSRMSLVQPGNWYGQLNVPFFQNSEFILNIVPVGKQ